MVWLQIDPTTGAKEATFPVVWFATENRARSVTKTVVFDDCGVLTIKPDSVLFQGEHTRILTTRLESLIITRQRPPWVMYILANLVVLIVASPVWFFPRIVGIGFLILLVVLNVLGIVIGGFTLWLRVEFRDEDGARRIAYFANGEESGWKGILGGTNKLQETLLEIQTLTQ